MKNMKKNISKQLIVLLAILASTSFLVAQAKEKEVATDDYLGSFQATNIEMVDALEVVPAGLAICDHNHDGLRNLTDVSIFATCKDTFDANNDGDHDLSDVALYTSNNQDNDFCYNMFSCTPAPVETNQANPNSVGSDTTGLAICDHNNDGLRNLSDVSLLAICKNTFDADNDGDHDLVDVTLYTSNYQDNEWCRINLSECTPQPSGLNLPPAATLLQEEKVSDVISNQPQVLGVKENNCKVDQDVLGQTEWADGSLIRACDMKVYRIENQSKQHIKNFTELLKYIGQRIYNVGDDIVALF